MNEYKFDAMHLFVMMNYLVFDINFQITSARKLECFGNDTGVIFLYEIVHHGFTISLKII
jgi:hypothetical protein